MGGLGTKVGGCPSPPQHLIFDPSIYIIYHTSHAIPTWQEPMVFKHGTLAVPPKHEALTLNPASQA